MRKVHIDFETRSRADLKKVGGRLYSECPSTSIMCIVYRVDDRPPVLLTELDLAMGYDEELRALAEAADTIFYAHNAAFEQAIWENILVKRHGYAMLGYERWRCTMAKAFAHGLSGSLDGAAKTMKLEIQKDEEGRKIMIMLSKPKKDGTFWTYDEVPHLFARLYSYCTDDVLAESALDNKLRDLSPKEQLVWFIDQRMNQAGIRVDLELARKAQALAATHKQRIAAECKSHTEGIGPTQRKLLVGWLQRQGVDAKNTKKTTINKMLEAGGLTDSVETVLGSILEANKTSIAKYGKMLLMSNSVGIMREQLQYHAAHTGRWGGRGVQVQNLTKPWLDINQCAQDILDFDYDTLELLYDDVAGLLSSTVRGSIIAPHLMRFFVADLSQMEARVTAWLAGEQWVLDAFEAYDNGTGKDLYCLAAEDIFGYPVDKSMKIQRQAGKVAVLALGFGGGIGAFAKMAEQYEIDLRPVFPLLFASSTAAERDAFDYDYMLYLKRESNPVNKQIAFVASIIKQRWRRSNANIEQYWADLEATVVRAIRTGEPQQFGLTRWFVDKEFLYCRLPSGRFMAYPYPALHIGVKGKIVISYHNAKYGRTTTYGGKLTENVVQAVQRDLHAEVILRLEEKYPVQFHVHDEVIAPVPQGEGDLEEYRDIVKQQPKWAAGLPIGASAEETIRYGKAA